MELIRTRKVWVDYLYIIVGVTIMAIAINAFFEPLDMVTGGVTGIAIIVKGLSMDVVQGGIPLWLTNMIINIPLFVLAIIVKGRDFGWRSLFATFFLSFALFYTQWVPVLTKDILLASIFGGVLAGVGLGLVFSAFSTTGGTDLAASLIQHVIKHVSIARIMMILDSIIILSGVYFFGAEATLYAVISVFISVKVIDAILDGLHFSKAAFIISDHHKTIAENIMSELDRGVTGLVGEGMFTASPKHVLFCVVSKREIVKLKEIVKISDPRAFVIVTDVREVLGEGFKEYEHYDF
ncbi:MAG: YitT family protein [Firmicutes bacterium HGW-Firmicutes-2]|jgi:uncharacterized membrane-anchored protein YitT (DUF2179 family)|nr:MAG: YitT family protein [Firmicutes bacterium HGW-Firmicutes-2]